MDKTARSRREDISVPLPLPIQFGLLPSLSPGTHLVPILYSLINDIPIYLTLSPTHPPHLSLLPLLLSLSPPISPLSILARFKLASGTYSLNLDGTAPHVDFWVEFTAARRICSSLGVSKLFHEDETDRHRSKLGTGTPCSKSRVGRKGLLSDAVLRAVSWDEGDCFGHNWLPATSHLPSSSYSLSSLLSTSFPSVEPIPEDRYISTMIDPARRANIISRAQGQDQTGIRANAWGQVWEQLLVWSISSWEAFLAYPSTPPRRPKKLRYDSSHGNMAKTLSTLLPLLPKLSGTSQPDLTFTPTLYDLEQILASSPTIPETTLLQLLVSIARNLVIGFISLFAWTYLFIPIHMSRPIAKYLPMPDRSELSIADVERIKLRARVDLGCVESLSSMVMGIWRDQRDLTHLKAETAEIGKGGVKKVIVLDCSKVDFGLDSDDEHSGDEQIIRDHGVAKRTPAARINANEGKLGDREMKGHSLGTNGSRVRTPKRTDKLEKRSRLPVRHGTEDESADDNDENEVDELDVLERRRGGSPPPLKASRAGPSRPAVQSRLAVSSTNGPIGKEDASTSISQAREQKSSATSTVDSRERGPSLEARGPASQSLSKGKQRVPVLTGVSSDGPALHQPYCDSQQERTDRIQGPMRSFEGNTGSGTEDDEELDPSNRGGGRSYRAKRDDRDYRNGEVIPRWEMRSESEDGWSAYLAILGTIFLGVLWGKLF